MAKTAFVFGSNKRWFFHEGKALNVLNAESLKEEK
jgi:hypothetical protein